MHTAVHCLDVLFGKGEDTYPFWLMSVRINILVFVLCTAALIAWNVSPARLRKALRARAELYTVLAVTMVAALLRFVVVEPNLADLGGISYSRILFGYKGHFGAAQLYSLVYARTARDLEHAIFLNRLAATLTVPLVYALCRCLAPATWAFAVITTVLLGLHPLHVLFSATDALPISSALLAAAAYLLLVNSVGDEDAPAAVRTISAAGAAAGLALLTQVRYESVLLLAPAIVYVLARRRALSFRLLAPGATLFVLFISIYAVEAMRWGSSYQNPVHLAAEMRLAARAVFDNPIFAIEPVFIGSAAALIAWKSRLRWLVPLPLIVALPVITLGGTAGHNLARTYLNQILLLSLIAGYGLALLWASPRWYVRGIAVGCMLWAAALPVLFWPNLRERHLETAEHDFFRAALAALPPGIDRLIVPDDEVLSRETHSTIEAMTKYRMIANAAGVVDVDLVGMTRFLEHRGDVDCSRGNCLFFRGVPCMGIRYYWFAEAGCAQLMATVAGPPVLEEEVVAGSFLDCSIYRGAERQSRCEPARKRQRLALYRVTN